MEEGAAGPHPGQAVRPAGLPVRVCQDGLGVEGVQERHSAFFTYLYIDSLTLSFKVNTCVKLEKSAALGNMKVVLNTIKMAILWYFWGLVPWSDFPSVQ